jgi:uncharacterized protein (TIGR00255 family)
MSVYSMTGFASAGGERSEASFAEADHDPRAADGPRLSVVVEARSVNGRFLDVAIRLPDELRALEPGIRDAVAARIRRGKVEVRVNVARQGELAWPTPRPEQLSRLAQLEDAVHTWLPKAGPLSVHEVLQWCRAQTAAPPRADDSVLACAKDAVAGLVDAREREGARLAQAMHERVAALRLLADRAEPLVPQAVARQREKFVERWNDAQATGAAGGASSTLNPEALAERALAEALAYAVRIDVAEELSRLRSHLEAIDHLLTKGGEVGKRLEFLIQELQREANTLGSKSTSLELTAIAVDMKVLVEQLREQVQNIE